MYFAGLLEVRADGGKIDSDANEIKVAGATSVTILVTAATGFRAFQSKPDTPLEQIVAKATARSRCGGGQKGG